jgi:hypothetical protein
MNTNIKSILIQFKHGHMTLDQAEAEINGVLADVRMSLCCKAPIDKDDDTSQYCTNCLDACESHSA